METTTKVYESPALSSLKKHGDMIPAVCRYVYHFHFQFKKSRIGVCLSNHAYSYLILFTFSVG